MQNPVYVHCVVCIPTHLRYICYMNRKKEEGTPPLRAKLSSFVLLLLPSTMVSRITIRATKIYDAIGTMMI
jgi:hypothetical protein